MRRRDFLRAIAGGTVAALLGVQARQLQTEHSACNAVGCPVCDPFGVDDHQLDSLRYLLASGVPALSGNAIGKSFTGGTFTMSSADGQSFSMPFGAGDLTYKAGK